MGDPPPENPFPGLRPFEEEEAHLFFGRKQPTYKLLERLAETSFVAVVGVSGSGKSSLVRCGVLPALYRGLLGRVGTRWTVAQLRPRNDPIGELAKALAGTGVLGKRGGPIVVETILRQTSLGLLDLRDRSTLAPHDNLLVLVDQFEELFRFKTSIEQRRSEDEAASFIKLLLVAAERSRRRLEQFRLATLTHRRESEGRDAAGAPPLRSPEGMVYVMLTMRSDYLGDCSAFPDLAQWINDGLFLVPLMTRDERRAAIEGPIALRERTIAPGLVNRLLNEVGDEPSRLPVLQHALMRTWDEWATRRLENPGQDPSEGCSPRMIDQCDYERACGLVGPGDATQARALAVAPGSTPTAGAPFQGALNAHLQVVWDREVPGHLKPVAERMFRRLTEVTPDGRRVRREATVRQLSEILTPPVTDPEEYERQVTDNENRVKEVVRIFRRSGNTFLTPIAGDLESPTLVDISHESLIERWVRLRDWTQSEAEDAERYRQLVRDAVRERAGEGSLLRGRGLRAVRRWLNRFKPTKAWALRYDPRFDDAMSFIRRSRTRGYQRWAAGLGGAAVIAAAGLGWSEVQRRADVRRAAIFDQASELLAPDAEGRVRNAYVGALVLRELGDVENPPGPWLDLARRVVSLPLPIAVLEGHGSVLDFAFDSSGSRAITVSTDGSAALWSLAPADLGRLLDTVPASMSVDLVAFRGDGTPLLFTRQGELATWAGDLLGSTIEGSIPSSSFSADGSRLVAVTENGRVLLRSTAPSAGPGAAGASPPGTSGDGGQSSAEGYRLEGARGAALSADGSRLAAWSNDTLLLVTPDTVVRRAHDAGAADRARFSPGGDRLVLNGRRAEIWDTEAFERVGCLFHRSLTVRDVAFSPDGSRLAAGFEEGVIAIWDLPRRYAPDESCSAEPSVGPTSVAYLPGGPRFRVVFSPDGRQVLSTSNEDQTARLWSAGTGKLELTLDDHVGSAYALFTPDGGRVVTLDDEGRVRIWLANGYPAVSAFAGPSGASAIDIVDLSPTESRIAVGHDGGVALFDLYGDVVPFESRASGPVRALAFSPNGESIGVATRDSVYVEALADSPTSAAVEPGGRVVHVEFGPPDGSHFLTASRDRWAREWETRGGSPVDSLHHAGPLLTAHYAGARDRIVAAYRNEMKVTKRPGADPGAPVDTTTAQPRGQGDLAALAVSPSGGWIAVGKEGSILVWRTESAGRDTTELALGDLAPSFEDVGRKLEILPHVVAQVTGAFPAAGDFCPQGRAIGRHWVGDDVDKLRFASDSLLLAEAADRCVRGWDVRTWRPVLALPILGDTVAALTVSPDGSRLVTASGDGLVQVWPLDWRGILDGLERALRLCLSAEQRVDHLDEGEAKAAEENRRCRSEMGLMETEVTEP